jgi:BMFP domain-containing protein YqiC
MNDNRSSIMDDVSTMLSGLGLAAQGVREEIEQAIGARVDRLMSDGAFVTREEFEAVRAMAEAARSENAELKQALDALSKKINK